MLRFVAILFTCLSCSIYGHPALLRRKNIYHFESIAMTVTNDITYSNEELEVMREVKRCLEKERNLSYVNPRFLAYVTIVSKCRVDEATEKYCKFLKATKLGGIDIVESDEDMYKDPNVDEFIKKVYIPCGTDEEGRRILWVRAQKEGIPEEMEKTLIRSGIMYTVAIHADNKSLREGITFVIDTSRQNFSKKNKIGNEAKVTKINQSYPLRPQAIYIAGTSAASRVIINGLIKVAAVFTKVKILQRIKFVTLDEAVEKIPTKSGPTYLGGGGGNIEDVAEWTRKRYESMPVPDL